MPPPIISSPFLNLPIIESLLSKPATPKERIQLLSAKLHLLTTASLLPSSSASHPPDLASGHSSASSSRLTSSSTENHGTHCAPTQKRVDPQPELRTRLDLGKAHLELDPPDWISGEAEFSLVEKRCKSFLKRYGRSKELSESKGRDVSDTLDEEGDPPWLKDLWGLRIEALEGMVRVGEGLGREGRAGRWKELIKELKGEAG